MNPPSPPQRDVDVLWRVNAFAYHRIAPGQPYWWDNRRRPQEDCVVQVTLAGRIVFRDYHAGRDHEVGPRQLLLFNHGEASAYGLPAPTPQPYECLWFEFRGAGLRDHIRAFQATYGPVMGLDPEDRILGKMHRLASQLEQPGLLPPIQVAAALHALLMQVFQHAEDRLHQRLSPVDRAVQQILRHPDQPLSLKETAHRFGCSREHLSRVFRQRTGQSATDYLARNRLRQAVRLITQTDLPIREVARQSGYPSMHTLARQLRGTLGLSPTALRQQGATNGEPEM